MFERWTPTLGAILFLCFSSSVGASPFIQHGFGARAIAMGSAQTASPGLHTAAYYNPAALAFAEDVVFGLGLDLRLPRMDVERAQAVTDDTPPIAHPADNLGLHVGAVFPLPKLGGMPLAIGIGLYLPGQQVTRVAAYDPSVTQFYRLDAIPGLLTINVGLALRVHPHVSLGVGMRMLGEINGMASLELDLLSRRFLEEELDSDVSARVAPGAGLLYAPDSRFSLGLSFRDAIDFPYQLQVIVDLPEVGRLNTSMAGVSNYQPRELCLGARWLPRENLTLTADFTWSQWSQAPDPASVFFGLLELDGLGLDNTLLESSPVILGAVDTLSARVGVEWWVQPFFALRGGYGFLPTPLPAQTGDTNYVDSDQHQLGMGLAWRTGNPMAHQAAPITFSLTSQTTVLEERKMEKIKAQDRTGSYKVSGLIHYVVLSVSQRFK